jgi:hypothetical protein
MSPVAAKFGSALSGVAFNAKLKERSEIYEKWLDENMSDEEKLDREIDAQVKEGEDKDHDDFAFMKNYEKDELK